MANARYPTAKPVGFQRLESTWLRTHSGMLTHAWEEAITFHEPLRTIFRLFLQPLRFTRRVMASEAHQQFRSSSERTRLRNR